MSPLRGGSLPRRNGRCRNSDQRRWWLLPTSLLVVLASLNSVSTFASAFVAVGAPPSLLSARPPPLHRGRHPTILSAAALQQPEQQQQQPQPQQPQQHEQSPPLAPLTVWGEPYADIVAVQAEARRLSSSSQPSPSRSAFGPERSARLLGLTTPAAQLQYLADHRVELLQLMQDGGCVIFRDFDLMQSQPGFVRFYEALQLRCCLDPLHSVAARPRIAAGDVVVNGNGDHVDNNQSNKNSKNSLVYEAVNKESRKNFFIGMHNEFVGTRAPAAAAFCCFQPATTGGEFLIADGRQIFRDLPSDLLATLYGRQIRYSVMELPFFDWIDAAVLAAVPPLRDAVAAAVRAVASAALNAKVDFDVELQWRDRSDYDGDSSNDGSSNNDSSNSNNRNHGRILQARAPRQPPVVRHPITHDPTWFCNVHSHSSRLRRDREAIYGAERFEDGASRINKSDMFFGDDAALTAEQLRVLDEVTRRNVRYVTMRAGDVVLLDNYKTLHGRNVFDGTRKHGVCWFEGWEGDAAMAAAAAAALIPQPQEQQQEQDAPAPATV